MEGMVSPRPQSMVLSGWYDLRDKVVCDESTVVPNTNSTVLLLLDCPHPGIGSHGVYQHSAVITFAKGFPCVIFWSKVPLVRKVTIYLVTLEYPQSEITSPDN